MNKIVDRLTLIMTAVSGALFFIVVIVTLTNIVGRSFFNQPVKGAIELIQYGVMLCAGFVMCRSGWENRHIAVSVLIDKFPPRLKNSFVALGKLLGAVFFGGLAYLNYSNIAPAIAANKVTDAFRAPFQIIYIAMAVCFAMGALIFLYQFCQTVVKVGKGEAGEALTLDEIIDKSID